MSDLVDNNRYTVGLVTATAPELTAAWAFLDEEHEEPKSRDVNDSNTYTLGKLGAHNVVIVSLPDGEYGSSTAAAAATHMIRTFRKIRILLMVGTGGGVPNLTKHDIRLGDVVVCSHQDGKGAVLQYDFGKAEQDSGFRPTGYMNLPPPFVRTAVKKNRSQHELKGNTLGEIIHSVFQKYPAIYEKYKRPNPSSDRLYQSWAVHDQSYRQTLDSRANTQCLAIRPLRASDEDSPRVHYGLIASGTTLMKNAKLRDDLSQEYDILCFEMEAAGLMNTFPCLVIRGISDYADSHKNDEWQCYAAMAAAAYAKDLLMRIPAEYVDKERTIADTLVSVEEKFKRLQKSSESTKATLEEQDYRKKVEDAVRWLQAPDASISHNKSASQRIEGSGLWLLEHASFKNWKCMKNSFLLLTGFAGWGKTVLTSTIIDNLQAQYDSRLLYFYFELIDPNKRTAENMLQSLIRQLVHKNKTAQKILIDLFNNYEYHMKQLTLEQLNDVFKQMLTYSDEIWIVLDALDECEKVSETKWLLSWMQDLMASRPTKIHLLATSRLPEDMKSNILSWAGTNPFLSIQNGSAIEDIRSYIRKRVLKDVGFRRWRSQPDVQQEIECQLMKKADGLFQLVARQLDRLEDCLDYPSLQKALATLPNTLCETYARMIHDIRPQFNRGNIRILQLLVYGRRPLVIPELVDAVAVDLDRNPHFKKEHRMPSPKEITQYCPGLVEEIEATDISLMFGTMGNVNELRLAHLSIKEYLTSNQVDVRLAPYFEVTLAETTIASICVAYLLQLDLSISPEIIDSSFPFARYCAEHWMDHAAMGDENDISLSNKAIKFLQSSNRTYFDRIREKNSFWPLSIPGIYHASAGGFLHWTKILLENGANINQRGGEFGSALQAAVVKGHTQTVELLLRKGADANACSGVFSYAMYAASFLGHASIVKLLLVYGADPDVQEALDGAVKGGNETIVNLLLDHGVNMNRRSGSWHAELDVIISLQEKATEEIVQMLVEPQNTAGIDCETNSYPLIDALWYNLEEIAKTLLEHGADTEVECARNRTPLLIACERGYKDLVQLLLDKGADVNRENKFHKTPLQAAIVGGHFEIVRKLIEKGAGFNIPPDFHDLAIWEAGIQGDQNMVRFFRVMAAKYESERAEDLALQAACRRGDEKEVQTLLTRGADVNAPAGRLYTALQAAVRRGSENLVHILLDYGAQINAVGGKGGTALHIACSQGHKRIAEQLLAKGAELHTLGEESSAVLQDACKRGHDQIVQLLLAKDEGKMQQKYYNEALIAASEGGNKSIVRMLLKNGADVDAMLNASTPLQIACLHGNKGVVQVLLENGANVNWHGRTMTPLSAACKNNCLDTIQMLLDQGADVNFSASKISALQEVVCASTWKEEVVQLLLYHGANVGAQDDALAAASGLGRLHIVQILLDYRKEVDGENLREFVITPAEGESTVACFMQAKDGERKFYDRALHAASAAGHRHVVELLLERGTDINAIHKIYGNALYAASINGHCSVVETLLRNGADPNSPEVPGWRNGTAKRYPSILYAACAENQIMVAETLLDGGADLNAAHAVSGTALFIASLKSHTSLVRILLSRGVDVNKNDFNPPGEGLANALHAAVAGGDIEIIKLLLDNDADINSQGGVFGTPLQVACAYHKLDAAMLLLNRGADVNIQTGRFGNAVQTALAKGEEWLAGVLFDKGAYVDASQHGYKNALDYLESNRGMNNQAYYILRYKSPLWIRGQKRTYSLVE